MQISFGKIIYINEIKTITDKQSNINDIICNIFHKRDKQNGKGSGNRYLTLDELLKKSLKADIFITNMKNGNVEITLAKKTPKGHCEVKDFRQLIINKKRPIRDIALQIRLFSDKCRDFANNDNSLSESFNIFLQKRREAILRLRRDERFRKEFQKKDFN